MKFIITLILFISVLYAKNSDFSIVIKEPFSNVLFDITEDYNRDICAVGFIKKYNSGETTKQDTAYTNAFDYLASLSKSSNGSQTHLVKINNQADIILSKSTALAYCNEALSIVKTPQNDYLIGAHTLDGSLLIIKTDTNGQILFHKTFGTANQDKMNKMILLRDGGALAIGTSATSRSRYDTVFESGMGLSDIFIARFSKSGELLWQKKYGTEQDDTGIDAAEADDGSIVILAQTTKNSIKNPIFLRVTQNGDKIWLKEYKNEKSSNPHKILKLRNATFVASLSEENDMNKEQIKLVKIDLNSNILHQNTIETRYPSVLKDIKESQEGKIIGVGFVQDRFNTDGLVMLLDDKFSMLTQEHYGSEAYDAFHALTILHNSQIAVAGVYTDKNSQETNMWIVKLNQDLSMAKKPIKTTKSTTFYTDLLNLFKDEIKAKKIEIKEDLSISLIDAKLYFKAGEYLLTNEQKEFLQKLGNKLIPFLHKNRETLKTLEINGHTSSEWGTSDFSQRYLNNSQLSMQRSFATLSYLFALQKVETQKWLFDILKGSGESFSKRVIHNDGEDKESSRRVIFKIILK